MRRAVEALPVLFSGRLMVVVEKKLDGVALGV